MNIFKYTFQCEKIPSKLTMHSVLTHYFGKDNLNNINFKVSKEGRLIRIISDTFLEKEFKIELFNKKAEKFLVILKDIEKFEMVQYEKEKKVELSGIIEYGVNVTGQKGKKCPFHMGKFNSSEQRNKFKDHIEKTFGVKVIEMQHSFFNRKISEELTKHIQINNIIELNLPVIIKDEELFNKIQYQSFFQKRSYGYGNIEIS